MKETLGYRTGLGLHYASLVQLKDVTTKTYASCQVTSVSQGPDEWILVSRKSEMSDIALLALPRALSTAGGYRMSCEALTQKYAAACSLSRTVYWLQHPHPTLLCLAFRDVCSVSFVTGKTVKATQVGVCEV